MNTFDLIFFNDSSSKLARYIVTPKKWDHVGIILHNPTWLHPGLTGTFVWEMCKCSSGTTIIPYTERIANYKGQVYIRKCKVNKINKPKLHYACNKLLCNTHDAIHNYLRLKQADPENDTFWSPGFLCYILVRMDFLNIYGLDWKTISINDFEPSGRIDKYLLPGLEYADTLTKMY